MGEVIITLKVMPESPEIELEPIAKKIINIINKKGKFYKKEIKPVAFGLNELDFIFLLNEENANELENIEEEIKKIEGVSSVETIDVRRAI